ncbi:MAG TPA: methyltransferase domain-containing protein [Allosphingosinicella sp.]|jgi:predicted methyltransferase
MLITRTLTLASLLLTPVAAVPAAPADVRSALAASDRAKENVALDEVRKPAEVLAFLGLKKGDRALDYFTGAGYYAEVMAKAVGPKGTVVGWNATPFVARAKDKLAAIRVGDPNLSFYATPATALSFPTATFDFAMLHLVYHDAYWESAEYQVPRIDPATVVQALFQAVKPGGIVAVIDHAAAPGGDTRAVVEKLHRIDPAVVKADFERAGFVLEAQSPLLAVPGDDHSKNVFDPSIRGRTDRFVYRFRRP